MRFQIYQDGQLAAICEYGQEPTYHGSIGESLRATIEASLQEPLPVEPALSGVPSQWLSWAASIVYPVLSTGALVRWYA
jgi:hypothetical protein